MEKQYYIGLDVHQESIAIAYTFSGSRAEAKYHTTCGGSNLAAVRALRKLAKELGVKLQALNVPALAPATGSGVNQQGQGSELGGSFRLASGSGFALSRAL